MSHSFPTRTAVGLLMMALSACAASDTGESDLAGADQALVPELVWAGFAGRLARVELDAPLDDSLFDLARARLSSSVVKADGAVERLTLAAGATLSEDGRMLELALADTPVLGRVYDIVLERFDDATETKLGEIWAETPEELRQAAALGDSERQKGLIINPRLPPRFPLPPLPPLPLPPRIVNTNTDHFVAKRTDPTTSTASPALLRRRDHVDEDGVMIETRQETRAITVFFGHRNKPAGADSTQPAERIDCSWIPSGSRHDSPETNRNLFRISTTRPGSTKGQLMFQETDSDPYFFRGRVSCDPFENSLTFHLPGRLLGAADVTLYAVAKSLGGYYAEREFRFRVENPDVRVDLTKVRQHRDECLDFGLNDGCSGWRLPDTYVASATAVNTGRIAADAERGVVARSFGYWDTMWGGREEVPASTELYTGPVGIGMQIGLAAMDHDDTSTEQVLSEIWKVSSAIFCATYSYCPNEVIEPAGEVHDMITEALRAAGDDDRMGGTTLVLGRYGDPQASTVVGNNWGLDLRPGQAYNWTYGYEVNIQGHVSVWLKFDEAQPSWRNPVDLF